MIPTIITVILLAAALVGASVSIIKNKRSGQSGCGCGCSGCAMRDECHAKAADKKL